MTFSASASKAATLPMPELFYSMKEGAKLFDSKSITLSNYAVTQFKDKRINFMKCMTYLELWLIGI